MSAHIGRIGGAALRQLLQRRHSTVHDVLEADSHIETEITHGRATITHGEPRCEAIGRLTGAERANQAERIRHQRALRFRRFFLLFSDPTMFSSSSTRGKRTLSASTNSHSHSIKKFRSVSQPLRPYTSAEKSPGQ